MKRHSIEQTAAWAKSWNMRGFEHLYPENREKQRSYAVNDWNKNNRENFNKTLTKQGHSR